MPFDATPQFGRPGSGPWLEGKLLIAMPDMSDPRFRKTVIFMCAHSPSGALGIIINKYAGDLRLSELLEQIGLQCATEMADQPVQLGGPVETERGFVLHSRDFFLDEVTLPVSDQIGLTASVEVLRAIADGKGPVQSVVALGYAGWGPGQLEAEMQANAWLHCDGDSDILFSPDMGAKWDMALAKLGVDPSSLSGQSGHA